MTGSNINFDQLIELCSKPKIQVKPAKVPGPMEGAFNGGCYLGTPGKDIYLFLPKLTAEQFEKLVDVHSKQYPKKPPGNHVGVAACVRYIYGQFEKQGTLRSPRDMKRMRKEGVDWKLPRRFIEALRKKFKERKHYYGLCILAEMEGHRLGDEALLQKSRSKLNEMEKTYLDSVKYAHKCKSFKQMFTPYYWSAKYFMVFEDEEKALHYSKTTILEAEKHCPDARASYVDKLLDCANYLKKKGKWHKWRRKVADANNRAVKKMLRKT